jgi:hypothetical protein
MTCYIRVQPGNFGNQMFRYMLAQHITDQVPCARIIGYQMPEWGLCSPADTPEWHAPFELPPRHRINVCEAVHRLTTGHNDGIDIRAYAQRLEYFGHDLDRFRDVFYSSLTGSPLADDEIAVNVRAADILAGIHPDYFPMPVSFYVHLLGQLPLRPVFIGQLDDCWYTEALRQTFPGARFLTHDSAIEDFQTLRHARHKVLAISTFSWLAGWLSRPDCVIHYPLAGLLNPLQRPQIDLAPVGDARYRFYRFPVWRYSGNEIDIRTLLSTEPLFGDYVSIRPDEGI